MATGIAKVRNEEGSGTATVELMQCLRSGIDKLEVEMWRKRAELLGGSGPNKSEAKEQMERELHQLQVEVRRLGGVMIEPAQGGVTSMNRLLKIMRTKVANLR